MKPTKQEVLSNLYALRAGLSILYTLSKKFIGLSQDSLLKEIKRFNGVYDVLVFNGFLDERDWANLDLVIYLYQTGKAVDLFEALGQVDIERNNKKLISTVQTATKAIAPSLKSSLCEPKQVDKASPQLTSLYNKIENLINADYARRATEENLYSSSYEMTKDIRSVRALSHRTVYNV